MHESSPLLARVRRGGDTYVITSRGTDGVAGNADDLTLR